MCQLCRVLMQKHSAKWPSHVSRTATLPSAKVLALGIDLKVCRVPGPSTRQSDHVAGPWEAPLPSARRRHSAKLVLCRVPAVSHSAKSPPRVAPRGSYAEGQGSRQRPLCRERLCTLGKAFAECKLAFAECNRHSAKPVNPVVSIPEHRISNHKLVKHDILRASE